MRHPGLYDFKKAWPIVDMCKMRLKYTSTKFRRDADRLAAKVFRAQQVTAQRSVSLSSSLTASRELKGVRAA